MKKLMATLVLCLLACTSFALPPNYGGPPVVTTFPTNTILYSRPDIPVPFFLASMLSSIPDAKMTHFPVSGSSVGSNISASIGVGLSFSNGGWHVTGVGFGIAWKYSAEMINGKVYTVLHVTFNNGGIETTATAIITPQDLGLNPETTAENMLAGTLDGSFAESMVNGADNAFGQSNDWSLSYLFFYVTLYPIYYP